MRVEKLFLRLCRETEMLARGAYTTSMQVMGSPRLVSRTCIGMILLMQATYPTFLIRHRLPSIHTSYIPTINQLESNKRGSKITLILALTNSLSLTNPWAKNSDIRFLNRFLAFKFFRIKNPGNIIIISPNFSSKHS